MVSTKVPAERGGRAGDTMAGFALGEAVLVGVVVWGGRGLDGAVGLLEVGESLLFYVQGVFVVFLEVCLTVEGIIFVLGVGLKHLAIV